MSDRFADRVVMVTGGAAGIGAACAMGFAREGACVYVFDRDAEQGEETVREIRAEAGSAEFLLGDASDDAAVQGAVGTVIAAHGHLDVMHANAGIEWTKTIADTSFDDWQRVIGINLTGTYLACRRAMIQMCSQQSGVIVVTSSPHAVVTSPDAGAYAASKGGVLALTRALALEGAPYGVRANALLPGAIDTPMLRREALAAPDPEAQMRRFGAIHPLNRLGKASEVAEAALFLASDAASFVTGAALAVDGGLLAAQPGGPSFSYTC